MKSDEPFVSIVIPVYNAVETIGSALASVQRYVDKGEAEVIIIDGGSTDGTVAILQAIDRSSIRWISEPDNGIYHAMNKGIDRASGDWLYFLGADDELVVPSVHDLLRPVPDGVKIAFGDVLFENGYRMRSYFGARTWLQNTVHHQSAFYHRSLFDSFRYDTTLRLLADYELNLHIHDQALPVYNINEVIALCHSGGASSNLAESLKETNQVRGRFMKAGWKQYLLSFLLTAYYRQKQVRRQLYGHKI